MLQKLSIKNYAIIDEVELNFVDGFNAITGETGAGKSILLGALNLIRGARADTKVLYNADEKCIVEAVIQTEKSKFENHDLYDVLDDEIILRREITQRGKSRAFINDSLCTLSELKSLANTIIDIHNQFDTLSVLSAEFQMESLDVYAGNESFKTDYSGLYNQYVEIERALKQLKSAKSKSDQDLDYVQFQLNEFDKYELDDMDKVAIEQEYETLENAEEIKRILGMINLELGDSDHSIANRLIDLNRSVQPYQSNNERLQKIGNTLEDSIEAIQHIQRLVEGLFDELDHPAERIAELREWINHVNSLEKKHQVSGLEELIAVRDKFRLQSRGSEELDDQILIKEKLLNKTIDQLQKAAKSLSESRNKAIAPLTQAVEGMLVELAMPNAILAIHQDLLEEFSETGKDHIEFRFSANKGVSPQNLERVASGGELSRLALSIRSIIASQMNIETLIFDEIDTGISGSVAVTTGKILSEIASDRQVICITHSPQIASMANKHFYVNKKDSAERTHAYVDVLSAEERIVEIAKMLSNDPPSQAAIQNAQELLGV